MFTTHHYTLSLKQINSGIAVFIILALLSVLLPLNAITTLLRMIGAVLVLGILPGSLLFSTYRPTDRLNVLSWLGISAGISLTLSQLLTMISISMHIPVVQIATIYIALSGLGLLWYRFLRRGDDIEIIVEREQLVIVGLILFAGILLYIKGSPYFISEDHYHISITRRLAWVNHPATDNLYYVHNFIYTHPFPGVNFFTAMVTRVSDLDALFVYHKLRFFWGILAQLFVYVAARHIFESRLVAFAASLVAVLLTFNGLFADFPEIFLGQLAPYSHPSDVAMNVYLPALIVATLFLFEARGRRETIFYYGITLGLGGTLVVVHLREAIQYLVYLGAFFIALLIFRREKRLLTTTVAVAIPIIMLAGLYALYIRGLIGHVADLNEGSQQVFRDAIADFSLVEFFRPYAFQSHRSSWTLYQGIHPLIVLFSPLIMLVFHRRKLVLFAAMSVFVYLLILRFNFLAVPYVLLTYFEILVNPLRNIIFFQFMFAGIIFFLISLLICLMTPAKWLRLTTAGILGGIAGIATRFMTVDNVFQDNFFGNAADEYWLTAAIGGYLVVMVLILRDKTARFEFSAIQVPKWEPVFGVMIVAFFILSFNSGLSPLNLAVVELGYSHDDSSTPINLTPSELFNNWDCVSLPPALGDESCPPPIELVELIQDELPDTAIVLSDASSYFPPSIYAPVQMPSYPLHLANNIAGRIVFPEYYWRYRGARSLYGEQPMFNPLESYSSRREFIEALGITHVLLEPASYAENKSIFESAPEVFHPLYDDGTIALYEVRESPQGWNEISNSYELMESVILPISDYDIFERYLEDFFVHEGDTIFDPSSGLGTRYEFSSNAGIMLHANDERDEENQEDAFSLLAVLAMAEDSESLELSNDQQQALERWRNTKSSADLLEAGIDYLFVHRRWRRFLSDADEQIIGNPDNYQLIREWHFPETDELYQLYRPQR